MSSSLEFLCFNQKLKIFILVIRIGSIILVIIVVFVRITSNYAAVLPVRYCSNCICRYGHGSIILWVMSSWYNPAMIFGARGNCMFYESVFYGCCCCFGVPQTQLPIQLLLSFSTFLLLYAETVTLILWFPNCSIITLDGLSNAM